MRLIHITEGNLEGNLLYSVNTNLNVNPIPKNTFTEITRMTFDQISEYSGPANLTHKVSHHSKSMLHMAKPAHISPLVKRRKFPEAGIE